jgi:hypothetical protein
MHTYSKIKKKKKKRLSEFLNSINQLRECFKMGLLLFLVHWQRQPIFLSGRRVESGPD